MTQAPDDFKAAVRRKASFAQTMKAVAWAFFGVRKAVDQEKDHAQLNPVHVIIAGLCVAALFVVGLVTLAHWVVSRAAAV